MKEREFQAWIIDVAERFGWRCWHVPTPMRPIGGNKFVPEKRAAGLPDLILMHEDPPRLIFAEVKVDAPLSDAQKDFLRLARGVAAATRGPTEAVADWFRIEPLVGVYLWRPGNEDLIEATLRSKAMVA